MTVLSVIQEVCPVIALEVPSAVMSSTEREHVELKNLANEMAVRIGKRHDWELLKTLQTMNGDGATTAFSLPSDYMRMVKDAKVWSSRIQTPLTHITSVDKWLELDIQSTQYVIGVWTKYGGQIHIKPAMTATETAKFFYLSNLLVAPNSGSNKVAFTTDNDSFRLPERLLKLGMIWQWRANKGLPYAEDMATFEDALAEEVGNDKGARQIRVGRAKVPRDVSIAYPQEITAS